jgi:putative N6-adenine-specific DNA methylase
MKVCLWSRVAMRVLLEVGHFPAPDADALYAGARAVDWSPHLDARHTFAVSASVQDSATLRHSGFVALKVKDAVADALRDRTGARPDVNADDPDVALFLHLRGAEAHLYLDLAGAPLHRRGYRVAMTAAPLKETLAAAVLALGRIDTALPFVDAMAGSGTLAIEHALSARRIAPGLRRRFGFERWPDRSHATAWEELRREAREQILPAAPAPILARDRDPEAARAARRNAEAAGVADDVEVETGDFIDLAPRPGPGQLCMNPPYGERLAPAEIGAVVRALARWRGWAVVLLSGDPQLAQALRRRPTFSHRLWNGPLETRLLRYDRL